MARACAVTENLIRIALSVVNVKAAALHYETLVASHQLTGSDVGEFSHGRKQFSAILRCANLWINRETAKFLSSPLPSTKLPPHFYVSSDKSTPSRITNHAIMICLMVDGKRCAIPVNAPEVYTKSDDDGDVSGADAKELATNLYKELENAYSSISKEMMNGSYQGTVCNGAYQAAEFEATLRELCEQEDSGDFFVVLWDPPHCIDLALKDVFEGKKGVSKEFFDRLVQRSSIIHRLFQRGKMLSHAVEIAKNDDDLLLRLTSRSCATQFSASQYTEFRKLIDSLPLFIQTFRAFNYTETREFQIAGKDFVLDLCAVCDVMRPYIEFSVALQGLSVPCWKVSVWWDRLRNHVKQIEDNFSLNHVSPHLPLLGKYADEIIHDVFRKTKLVQGWRLLSSETRRVGNTLEVFDNWEAREPSDVENDVKIFMADLRLSFEARVASACKPIVNILTCFDLDIIIRLLCGERLQNGRIKLTGGEGPLAAYGAQNFSIFFGYVCSLPHIKRLSKEEGYEESLFQPALAHTVFYKFKTALKQYLWREDPVEHLVSWFNLPPNEIYACLEKFEIAKDTTTDFSFKTAFCLNTKNSTKPIIASLDEDAVLKSVFTDETLYNAIGLEACACLDIALAKGGTEAIVESYYSVMKSQTMSGGQHNDTLGLRYDNYTRVFFCVYLMFI